jgi:hypothetical protein
MGKIRYFKREKGPFVPVRNESRYDKPYSLTWDSKKNGRAGLGRIHPEKKCTGRGVLLSRLKICILRQEKVRNT